jgi:hypothetical protein
MQLSSEVAVLGPVHRQRLVAAVVLVVTLLAGLMFQLP